MTICSFFLSFVLSFSFFIFLSLFYTKQWHMFRRTYRNDMLHYTPVLLPKCIETCTEPQSTSDTGWQWFPLPFHFHTFSHTCLLSFHFPSYLSQSLYRFSQPSSHVHFQNHSASMTEVTWLRGQHRVTFASPQHFQTQWRGRMPRGSECLTKNTPDISV